MQKVDYESFGSSKENNNQPEKIIKDPFGKFEDINIQKTIPKNIIKDIKRKKEFIENGINRIEEASKIRYPEYYICLLYTSDAADDSLRVDLGGRRII